MDPNIKWYQNQDKVIITVDLKDIVNHNVVFEKEKVLITFSVKAASISEELLHYKKELDLNNEIDIDNSSYELKSDLKIYLKKGEIKIWDKLTKKKTNNVFIDWTNWNFVDEVPSTIKDNIVNNNIKEALASIDIPKALTDNELISQFELSESEEES